MPTQPYYVNGVRVPSVTTILSRFKESGALIHWAWTEGKEGRDYRETRDKAADAGTLAHAMIEADIRQIKIDTNGHPPEVLENALHAYNAYKEWKGRVKLQIAETELALVSKTHKFGGTLDAMFVAGKLTLGDFKTSNAVYTDHLVQVAGGYSLLWEENYPDQKLSGIEILRISKPAEPGDPVSFVDHWWGSEVIKMAQRHFLLLRHAYDLDKRLKSIL